MELHVLDENITVAAHTVILEYFNIKESALSNFARSLNERKFCLGLTILGLALLYFSALCSGLTIPRKRTNELVLSK